MKKVIILSLACLVCIGGIGGCVQAPAAQPTIPATTFDQVSNVIAGILQTPDDYLGEQVEITCYFQGWDLLGEVGEVPPVTRSDWVIADESGALHVTGMHPANLDPGSKDDVGTVIRLTATVAARQEQVYLEVVSVEVLTER